MTEYNGQAITYDRIGNPLTYRDGMTMTWKRGRQLTTLQTEENNIQYKYDSDSIRTSKIVDGVVHTYEYLDGLLMHETRGEQAYDYYYDANGQLYAVSYKLSENDTKKVYYFTHNWRGDIVGIYNGNGELKATYSYDAWGNVTAIEDSNGSAITEATDIANLNLFRYRGYYQDTETGFYLTGVRYYDPKIGRFISPDTTDVLTVTPMALTDKNLYAYCDNNPVVRADHGGEFWNYVIGGVVGAVVGGVFAAISGGDWKAIALGAGVGAVGGLLAASGVPAGFQIAAGGLLNGGSNLATQTLVEGKSLQEVDWIDVGIDTAIGAGTSVLSYGVTRSASNGTGSDFAIKLYLCKKPHIS